MITLNNSGVTLDEVTHTYHTESGEERFGITKCIDTYINPSKYGAIPEAVMQAAAERGSTIHSAIENYNTLGLELNEVKEFTDFKAIKEENNLTHVASEYIVTDGEYYASPIDWLCQTPDCAEDEVCIIDFKSTSTLDTQRLAAQLAIYKTFFVMQNSHLKVKRTGAIWLPKAQYGNAKLEWIEPFETSQVMLMLDAYRFGGEFEPIVSMVKAEPLPVPVAQIEQHIGNCIAMQKTLDTYLKELKAELLAKMVEADVQAYKGSHLSITIKKGYTRQGGYDADKLIAAIRELAPEKADEIINGSKKADTAVADSLLLKFK